MPQSPSTPHANTHATDSHPEQADRDDHDKSAVEKAGDQAKETGSRIKEGAKHVLQDAADEVVEQARGLAHEAKARAKLKAEEAKIALKAHVQKRLKEQAVQAADQKRSEVAGDVHTIAESLRMASGKIRDDGQLDELTRSLAAYLDVGAEQVDAAANYLREHDVESLTGEAQKLVRKHPTILIAAFAVGGVALARFLRQYDQRARANTDLGGDGHDEATDAESQQ